MNREWLYFQDTEFYIDRLHRWNHSTCTRAFFLDQDFSDMHIDSVYGILNVVNSQMAEQTPLFRHQPVPQAGLSILSSGSSSH